MEPELKAYLDNITSLLVEVKGEIAGMKGEMAARETRLRAEFWNWAKTADLRYKQDHTVLAGIEGRVVEIENRLMDLEFDRALALARSRPPAARVDGSRPNPPV